MVTHPDRIRGRSGQPQTTPVQELATAANVPVVLQPDQVQRDTTEALAELSPHVGVVAAFGDVLPDHLLAVFPHGVLNVHASLLPRHRGASPVATAIALGDEESGATIVKIDRELDTGPILGQVRTPIGPLDTTGMLTARIAELGADLLARLLPPWVAGDITAEEQQEGAASYTHRRSEDSGTIDWSRSAVTIGRQVRAYQPCPLATTKYRDERFVIHEAWPLPEFSAQAWRGLGRRRRRGGSRRATPRAGCASRGGLWLGRIGVAASAARWPWGGGHRGLPQR